MKTFPIIEKLGGRKAVARQLTRPSKGRPSVSAVAIGLWVHRGRIPGFAVVQMLDIARRMNLEITPSDFQRCEKRRQPKRGAIHAD